MGGEGISGGLLSENGMVGEGTQNGAFGNALAFHVEFQFDVMSGDLDGLPSARGIL
jgi:hypothetical protein